MFLSVMQILKLLVCCLVSGHRLGGGPNNLVQNVTDFINTGGQVVICKECLEIAGYDSIDTINGTIIVTPEITSKLLTNATVIDY